MTTSMDNAVGVGTETSESGTGSVTVTTNTRGKWSVETSSRNSPGGGGSASETVVVDGVNVFLDLEAIVLGSERDQPSRLPFRVARSVFPCRAQRVAHLYTSRMIPATCVLDALLAVRTIAIHDGENHVSLKVLDERG